MGDEQHITKQITIFYSYADEDKEWQDKLEKSLSSLRRREEVSITEYHHGTILPGSDAEGKVREYLDQAQIIFLLISPDFMAKHFDGPEMKYILELKFDKVGTPQIKVNQTPYVIPILVRPADWESTPFSYLQAFPTDKKTLNQQKDHEQEQAFLEVVFEVEKIIEGFNPSPDDTQNESDRQPERIYKSKMPLENPFFTGREDLLFQIHRKLTRQKRTALTHRQAIYGLGGIGKTQLAVKYVYRFRDYYKQILWINADIRETIINEFFEIAQDLSLQERNEKNQIKVVEAVKGWLETNANWLLVLDNADDLNMVQEFIPTTINGHVLLTTRAQALGEIAEPIQIERMSPEDGALLLLRRAKKIPTDGSMKDASQIDRESAEKIVQELDGLPLALDQAGAYIEESGGGLAQYLQLYQDQGVKLLQERSELSRSHSASVITTFSLAFEKVEQFDPVATNVLRLCAFLAPDAIPESLLTEYLSTLIVGTGPSVLQSPEHKARRIPFFSFRETRNKPHAPSPTDLRSMLDKASRVLLKFSLIHRDDRTSTFAVHRLVQAVLRDDMDKSTQRQWAERAIHIVNAAFPTVELHKVNIETWPDCEKLLPQVSACATLTATHQFTVPEASRLLNDAATYLTERAQYGEAEPLYQQALGIRKEEGGPSYAQSLHNLAKVDERQARYARAEQNLIKALKIREQVSGTDHPDVATSLNSLAELYMIQGKYDQAEPLYEQALNINRLNFETEYASISQGANSLATLYLKQKKYEKAEELYKTALEINEKNLGKDHPHTAKILHDWGEFYKYQGKLNEAETLHKRALDIREKVLGLKHPDTATSLNSIAELYESQRKGEEAEKLYQQSLSIREDVLGHDNPETATTIYSLAKLYKDQGKVKEAELLYKRVLSIREKKPGLNHPSTIENQRELANFYKSQQRLAEAERLYKQGLANRYSQLRPDDLTTRQNLQDLVELYKLLNKSEKIEQLYEDAFKQCSSRLGLNHPSTERSLLELLRLYKSQGKSEKVEQRYKEVLEARTPALTKNAPYTVHIYLESQRGLADFYEKQGKPEQAEETHKQELITLYQKLGRDHPRTIESRHNLAKLYEGHHKAGEAETIYRQALEICKQKMDPSSSHSIECCNDLAACYLRHRKFDKATPLIEKMLQICEPMVKEQPFPKEYTLAIVHSLANAATLYKEKYTDKKKRKTAESLFKQALKISEEELGKDCQDTVDIRQHYVGLLRNMGRYDEAAAVEIDAITMDEAGNN